MKRSLEIVVHILLPTNVVSFKSTAVLKPCRFIPFFHEYRTCLSTAASQQGGGCIGQPDTVSSIKPKLSRALIWLAQHTFGCVGDCRKGNAFKSLCSAFSAFKFSFPTAFLLVPQISVLLYCLPVALQHY